MRNWSLDDSPTVSEYYEPEIRDFARWSLHGFPKSMCHGWSSGMVPLVTRCLLGVRPVAPGYRQVALDPAPGGVVSSFKSQVSSSGPDNGVNCTFAATVPTPYGPINICRAVRGADYLHGAPGDQGRAPLPQGRSIATAGLYSAVLTHPTVSRHAGARQHNQACRCHRAHFSGNVHRVNGSTD